MIGPVICGVDGSDSATHAIRTAQELADRFSLPLVYLHVAEPDRTVPAAELLDETWAARGELVVEAGHPAYRLVAVAGEREASFLVVGNHGPRSSLLGSISADVSRRAPCPVVVVPPTVSPAQADDPAAGRRADGGIARFSLATRLA